MRKEKSFREHFKYTLDACIRVFRSAAKRYSGASSAFDRLLWHARTRSAMMRPSCTPQQNRTNVLMGLFALALHHDDWLRPVESWQPAGLNPRPIFRSLADHLFVRHSIPAFLISAWFDSPRCRKLPQHEWFKHLGRGQNIRTAGLPLRFTKTMAHLFSQAPHQFSVIRAIRWAQVRGLGGSEALARAIAGTRLGTKLENEAFWESVLYFFINQRKCDLSQVGPIVDFLQYQRFEWSEGVSTSGIFGMQPPPQPNFTMKGRTAASMARLVVEWHKHLGQELDGPSLVWRRSPFKDFRFVDGSEDQGNMRVWTIAELLTSRDLRLEGKAMRHCVATYLKDCLRGTSSIWSLKLENRRGTHRVLTIELDPQRRLICQIRGRCNRLCSAAERGLVGRWAAEQGLKISEYA